MLKLVSLNVERSKHLDRVVPFLVSEDPDIASLQEVLEADIDRLAVSFGAKYWFWLPDVIIDSPTNSDGKPGASGILLLSKYPLTNLGKEYYYLPPAGVALEPDSGFSRETNAQGIIWASLEKEGEVYCIANTHFTWTHDGYPDELQDRDFESLRPILGQIGPHVLTGDLNAPRGRGIWERFAALYDRDNIPSDVVSTIDPTLHRFGYRLSIVVDALFTSREFVAEDVRVVSGLSDHQAVVATIRLVQPML